MVAPLTSSSFSIRLLEYRETQKFRTGCVYFKISAIAQEDALPFIQQMGAFFLLICRQTSLRYPDNCSCKNRTGCSVVARRALSALPLLPAIRPEPVERYRDAGELREVSALRREGASMRQRGDFQPERGRLASSTRRA